MNAPSSTATTGTVKYFFPAGTPINRTHVKGETLFVLSDQRVTFDEAKPGDEDWLELATAEGKFHSPVRVRFVENSERFRVS